MSHNHTSLRDRLIAMASEREHPKFEPSTDPTLISFGRLFVDSGLYSFDANKRLRTGALSPIYDCETESRPTADAEPHRFVAIWTPVWEHTDPLTGFRTGRDSELFGSTPTVAMPQDERTAALLLLVTSTFVHLSGGFGPAGDLLVQGAFESDDNEYGFVQLASAQLFPHPTPASELGRS